MHPFRNLIGAAILLAATPASAAVVFVQHLGDVTQSSVLAIDSDVGFNLRADLINGEFKILADASAIVPVNNNFAGTLRPVEFTNTTGVTVVIPAATPPTAPGGATGLQAHVHADLIAGPPSSLVTGGSAKTDMRVSGVLFVRVVGGSGFGEFLASGLYQESAIYNIDGSVREFIPDFDGMEENGAHVEFGGGGGLSFNMDLLMPELVLDPGARLQVSFLLGGDAFDSSTTDAFNTARLSLTLPEGVVLANDVGQPLAWVRNEQDAVTVPEPASLALMALGLGLVAASRSRSAAPARDDARTCA